MTVALLSVELYISEARSLKDKRVVLRSLKDRLKKFNVAVAEIDHQNLWQRAELGIVTVATSTDVAERLLASVADEIERLEPGRIARTSVELLT